MLGILIAGIFWPAARRAIKSSKPAGDTSVSIPACIRVTGTLILRSALHDEFTDIDCCHHPAEARARCPVMGVINPLPEKIHIAGLETALVLGNLGSGTK